jgi:hypothetical protein
MLVLTVVFVAGCASTPAEKTADTMEAPATTMPATGEAKDEPSQVLNKNTKCPKKSKMVNGKCLLQVESSE